jgi:hypothetical protein
LFAAEQAANLRIFYLADFRLVEGRLVLWVKEHHDALESSDFNSALTDLCKCQDSDRKKWITPVSAGVFSALQTALNSETMIEFFGSLCTAVDEVTATRQKSIMDRITYFDGNAGAVSEYVQGSVPPAHETAIAAAKPCLDSTAEHNPSTDASDSAATAFTALRLSHKLNKVLASSKS